MTAECSYTLQWNAPSPLKIPLPAGDLDPFSSSIKMASRVTDRQTDQLTDQATRSVTTVRIYVRSTAMQPNNG